MSAVYKTLTVRLIKQVIKFVLKFFYVFLASIQCRENSGSFRYVCKMLVPLYVRLKGLKYSQNVNRYDSGTSIWPCKISLAGHTACSVKAQHEEFQPLCRCLKSHILPFKLPVVIAVSVIFSTLVFDSFQYVVLKHYIMSYLVSANIRRLRSADQTH